MKTVLDFWIENTIEDYTKDPEIQESGWLI
jgi:hypothetical protein